MNQQPFEQELRLLEQRFTRQMDELIAPLDTRLQVLERPVVDATQYFASPNYLPNSHPEWSTLAYGTAGTTPSTAGDTNRECFNWYRQKGVYDGVPTTALAATAANALKRSVTGAQHSLWAANEGANTDIPIWDGVNGTIKLGGSTDNYDVACKLPTDFVFPGHSYYVYFEAALASTSITKSDDLQIYCGFWDNTAGQQKWIEGDNFTPTASVWGAEGSRTIQYKIIAETDSGTQILSTTVTVNNAPDTLTNENHIRLSFAGAPGFIYYGIYRYDGTTYRRVHEIRNSIDLQYYDMQETVGAEVGGFPVLSAQRPRAFAISNTFEPGAFAASSFTGVRLKIQVPLTYNRGNTTNGNQWFRLGLDALMSGGNERGIVIRRISVSEGYGGWVRSNRDMSAASSPTSSAASAPPTTNPGGDPPSGGSGGTRCMVLDTLVDVWRDDKIESIEISELNVGDTVAYGAQRTKVLGVKEGTVQEIFQLITESGHLLKCTGSHKLIKSVEDRNGTSVKNLKENDYVLVQDAQGIYRSRIIRKSAFYGSRIVKSVKLEEPHLFVANGFISHNVKDLNQI